MFKKIIIKNYGNLKENVELDLYQRKNEVIVDGLILKYKIQKNENNYNFFEWKNIDIKNIENKNYRWIEISLPQQIIFDIKEKVFLNENKIIIDFK